MKDENTDTYTFYCPNRHINRVTGAFLEHLSVDTVELPCGCAVSVSEIKRRAHSESLD